MNGVRTNWAAILVAAVVYFLMGAVWYDTHVFGTAWMRGIGKTLEQLHAENANSPLPYILALVSNLVLAYALSWLILRLGALSAARGAWTGAMLWVGFVATSTLTQYAFEMRPRSLFLINTGYALAGMLVMGAILGAWVKRAPGGR